MLTPVTVAEEAGVQSLRADGGPGFIYLVAEPWDTVRTWIGETSELQLTLRYFDGGPGTLLIRYDSSDQRFRLVDSTPPGAWRTPDTLPKGQPLTGERKWKTLTVRLPFAYFTKRLNGGDLRIEGQGKDFALAGIALTRVSKGQEASIAVKQELRVARTVGLESFATGARFIGRFVQDGAAPIVMEAELSREISSTQGNGAVFNPQASGGGAAQYIASATYGFTVVTPGQYVIWERGYFPPWGVWRHSEWVDDAQHEVLDGNYGTQGVWAWVRAGVCDLKAGNHTFKLNFLGGASLDVIVLTREDTQPDLATLRSSYQGATTGEIWTVPVKPFDVARWRDVQFRLPATVEATYEYSLDSGKTWKALASPEDLSALPVKGGGSDSVQFHITARSRDGKTPFLFGGGTLTYQAGPRNTQVVENSRLKIEFDTYGIRSIFDKRAGLPVAQAPAMHDSFLSLTLKKPGDATPFIRDLYNATLERCEVGGTADTPVLTLTHVMDNGLRVTTTGTLLPNGQSEWQMAIENPTEFEVAEFRFPVVTGIALGGTSADD
jgi:hypothetical protein